MVPEAGCSTTCPTLGGAAGAHRARSLPTMPVPDPLLSSAFLQQQPWFATGGCSGPAAKVLGLARGTTTAAGQSAERAGGAAGPGRVERAWPGSVAALLWSWRRAARGAGRWSGSCSAELTRLFAAGWWGADGDAGRDGHGHAPPSGTGTGTRRAGPRQRVARGTPPAAASCRDAAPAGRELCARWRAAERLRPGGAGGSCATAACGRGACSTARLPSRLRRSRQ